VENVTVAAAAGGEALPMNRTATFLGPHVPVADDCNGGPGASSATFTGDYAAIQSTGDLTVWNLRTGRQVGGAAIVESDVLSVRRTADPVLLQEDGSVAWIGTAFGNTDLGTVVEVRAMKGGMDETLDSGAGIDPLSLDVSGSTVNWTKDGAPKSAGFPA
jgi:hypothetical protein